MGVFLLVIDVALLALVEMMKWLGLTGKFGQGNIPTPLTTPIPIITCRTTLIPTRSTKNGPTTKHRHTSTNLVPELRIISSELK